MTPKTAKPSPAPWTWDGLDDMYETRLLSSNGSEVLYTRRWDYGESSNLEVRPEDARLIAAAPDLLEALEGVLRTDDSKFRLSDDDWTIFRALARAAIAKARGEQ